MAMLMTPKMTKTITTARSAPPLLLSLESRRIMGTSGVGSGGGKERPTSGRGEEAEKGGRAQTETFLGTP
jgi:hypothetical protein